MRPVSVNGREIPRAAIAQEAQFHPAASLIEARRQAAMALVIRQLLLDEAARLGVEAAPARDDDGREETPEEALIRRLIEQQVAVPSATPDECRRYYEANQARFRSPDLHLAAHILLACDPRDGAARAVARTEAARLIGLLRTQPERFADLARAHSDCPSAGVGGALGQIGPGQTVPEFERALATLPVGVIAPSPVETRYGVHVVRLDRRVEGAVLPFDLVAAPIAAFLDERVRQVASRHYVQRLAAAAVIEGVALAGADSPLVQ